MMMMMMMMTQSFFWSRPKSQQKCCNFVQSITIPAFSCNFLQFCAILAILCNHLQFLTILSWILCNFMQSCYYMQLCIVASKLAVMDSFQSCLKKNSNLLWFDRFFISLLYQCKEKYWEKLVKLNWYRQIFVFGKIQNLIVLFEQSGQFWTWKM